MKTNTAQYWIIYQHYRLYLNKKQTKKQQIMKTKVTELVKFKVLETTTEDQLLSTVEAFNDFQKKQDGFIDSELVKNLNEDFWQIIYHYENMEKCQVIGKKLRESEEFGNLMSVLDTETLSLSFFSQVKTW